MAKRVYNIKTNRPWNLKVKRVADGFIEMTEHHNGSERLEPPRIVIPPESVGQLIQVLKELK